MIWIDIPDSETQRDADFRQLRTRQYRHHETSWRSGVLTVVLYVAIAVLWAVIILTALPHVGA